MRSRRSQSKHEEEAPQEVARGAGAGASGTRARRKKSSSFQDEPQQAVDEFLRQEVKDGVNEELSQDSSVKESTSAHAEGSLVFGRENMGQSVHCYANEMDWEDGTISVSESGGDHCEGLRSGVTIEFTESPSSAQRKPSRRASADEKELAELVHKVHLLCLLARGRLVDRACNDPLIQASLLSLIPSYLHTTVEVPKLTADRLGSLVNWFYNNFHVRNQNSDRGSSFKSNLAFALETREGTAEEVAALSVALFRALNLTTRFISILDVVSLKPDFDQSGSSNQVAPRLNTRVVTPNQVHAPCHAHLPSQNKSINEDKVHEERGKGRMRQNNSSCKRNLLQRLAVTSMPDDCISGASASKACIDDRESSDMKLAGGSKRKGDVEFELQLEMALSATAAGVHDKNFGSKLDELQSTPSSLVPPYKRMRKSEPESQVVNCGSTSAVWSRRTGPPLYWAEVYCSGETLTGRWVHVDAANGIVDGEQKVESAAAACRRPLKYVIAFAGNGAKDVTRRYCMHWYKVAPQRINPQWWDSMITPLKELESGATGGTVHLEASSENCSPNQGKNILNSLSTRMDHETSNNREYPDCVNLAGGHGTELCEQLNKAVNSEARAPSPRIASRNALEDMEMETRALTESLPTNQLAYKNHHLYVIERWLTKHQILHPKGPVLGYCSGLPVYPRSCVQTLQTKHKWLREGLQVKPNEVPAKIVRRSKNFGKPQRIEPSASEEDDEVTVELYGKWQMEPLNLPRAVNGIVPKNERGQVDVWSEKCLPPGTVHLRLPRLVPVAKRLGVDFAPAMVGFEFRNGRSIPIFEGIVVCTEFKDAILEAYGEEEERREAEEKKRNEAQALSRWFQLLSSIIVRQRLQNYYVDTSSLNIQQNSLDVRKNNASIPQRNSGEDDKQLRESEPGSAWDIMSALPSGLDHEHVYPLENQSFDEENFVRTKRCPCGFSIQVEEL